MRLRNVPGSREAIAENPLCIIEENPQAGNWHTVFGNNHPIHIEAVSYTHLDVYKRQVGHDTHGHEACDTNCDPEHPHTSCFQTF